ncbi:MAG: ABZJ_00895 family protein [Paracoccaceae bacterium]
MTTAPSLTPILRDFTLGYLLAVLAYGLLATAVAAMGGPSVGAGGAIVPVIAAVFYAGHREAGRVEEAPSGGAAWRIAFALLGLVLAINVALFAVYLPFASAAEFAVLGQVFGPEGAAILPVILSVIAGLLGLILLVIRFLFPGAVRSGLKARRRAR